MRILLAYQPGDLAPGNQVTRGTSTPTCPERDKEFMCLLPSLFSPEEIDSDACALRTAKEICGAEYVSQFLSKHPLPRCPYPAYLKLLECVQLKCLNELGVRNEAG